MAKKISKKVAVKKKPAKKAKAKKPAAKKIVKKSSAKKSSPKKKTSPKKAVKKSIKKPAVVAVPKSLTVNPHITFNGNCEDAFNFYRSVFGGKFDYLGKYKEMPTGGGQPLPAEQGEKIMHISLPISKETILMGNDALEGFGSPTTFGNNFTVSIYAPSQKQADSLFKSLSAGGSDFMPMSKTFWGSYFGMLIDKFGVNWMISADQ